MRRDKYGLHSPCFVYTSNSGFDDICNKQKQVIACNYANNGIYTVHINNVYSSRLQNYIHVLRSCFLYTCSCIELNIVYCMVFFICIFYRFRNFILNSAKLYALSVNERNKSDGFFFLLACRYITFSLNLILILQHVI